MLTIKPELCEALLAPEDVITALAAAHAGHHAGRITQPLPVALAVPGHDDLGPERPRHVLMSACDGDITVVKTLLDAPARRRAGDPAQRSVVSAYSTATGECLVLVDGRTLTRVRTAAATVLAASHLARPGSRVLGVLGAGPLAEEHVRAARERFTLDAVVVWSRTRESADALVARVARDGTPARAVASPALVAAEADVVFCVTPSTAPLLDVGDLRPGIHVAAVGSPPRPGYQEVTGEVLMRADVVAVDDVAIASAESHTVAQALRAGMSADRLVELGAIVAGDHPGRTSRDQVTVHSSIGVALQDLAAVRLLLDRLAAGAGVAPTTAA
ncbi:ornithine cyclodeaminase family protein [Cellulomonas xiejunii]|uniref:Ornithine cyclodeaminase n=1 Tax=Cellulomonas xiejunii TaxID=2968083 RepID=A0ABY5KWG6_9CELL|nr:hypothetical protein [Cellulomonas xiejunii]MCC2323040.1 hypothetical protein [Cellulomonas xiejunii]UUI73536.1 hypothetical protein NP048_08940 [Cellulomonas xiejunii]